MIHQTGSRQARSSSFHFKIFAFKIVGSGDDHLIWLIDFELCRKFGNTESTEIIQMDESSEDTVRHRFSVRQHLAAIDAVTITPHSSRKKPRFCGILKVGIQRPVNSFSGKLLARLGTMRSHLSPLKIRWQRKSCHFM